MSDIKQKNKDEYLGLVNLPVNYKKSLFDLMYYYQYIYKFLRFESKLEFDEKQLSGVMGVLSTRNDYIDRGCNLVRLIFYGKFAEQTDYLGDFDFSSLDNIVKEFKKVANELTQKTNINLLLKIFIWFRYSDWRHNLIVFAKWFLILFVFFSILYFLVTTEIGRQVAWDFLAVYNVFIRVLMIILLIVAVVLIVGIVSFMYFEGKSKKSEK